MIIQARATYGDSLSPAAVQSEHPCHVHGKDAPIRADMKKSPRNLSRRLEISYADSDCTQDLYAPFLIPVNQCWSYSAHIRASADHEQND